MGRLALLACVFCGAAVACAPKYPRCGKDDDCKQHELCVQGQCQQCRADGDCRGGRCDRGRCVARSGCATDADCGGRRCVDGKCLAAGACLADSDCPPGHECVQGKCAAPPAAPRVAACAPDPVYFDFDEALLTSEATTKLKDQVAPCLKKAHHRVRVEGHCDPRGTPQYNLALGERRAQVVRKYLERLGIAHAHLRTLSKGELEATGTDERGWSRDRRAQFAFE